MGMSTGGSGKPGAVQSDINVTPLIDVLLVLLIIFLVIMPVMMKMETLEVPRKLDDQHEMPDPNATQLTVIVHVGGDMTFKDNDKESQFPGSELLHNLRPRIEALAQRGSTEKVVFVDFDPEVQWEAVVSTMDTIRALAADVNHDEVKVALKVKEDKDETKSP
jgi:biopolymer transport protein TolR